MWQQLWLCHHICGNSGILRWTPLLYSIGSRSGYFRKRQTGTALHESRTECIRDLSESKEKFFTSHFWPLKMQPAWTKGKVIVKSLFQHTLIFQANLLTVWFSQKSIFLFYVRRIHVWRPIFTKKFATPLVMFKMTIQITLEILSMWGACYKHCQYRLL